VCHEISWRMKFRRQSQEIPQPVEGPDNQRCLFLKQDFITRSARWNLRQRYLSGERGSLDVQDLRAWFEANYPGVEIHPGDWPKTVELIKYAGLGRNKWEWILNGKWGIAVWLLLVVTGIVGGLTKFKVGKASHASWLLAWLYGGPLFRWKWLFVHSFDKEPCPSLWKWVHL
jgi:hypothetical protein